MAEQAAVGGGPRGRTGDSRVFLVASRAALCYRTHTLSGLLVSMADVKEKKNKVRNLAQTGDTI